MINIGLEKAQSTPIYCRYNGKNAVNVCGTATVARFFPVSCSEARKVNNKALTNGQFANKEFKKNAKKN